MTAGAEIRLVVHRPANGGAAIGHAPDGRVAFVEGAIPGEEVIAEVRQERRGFVFAQAIEVIDASPHRRAGVCAAAAHGAGCCDQDFVDPAYLRALKAEIRDDALTRIGHVAPATIEAALRAGGGAQVRALDGDDTGWRIRTRLFVDADGRPGLRRRGDAAIVAGRPCAQPDPVLTRGLTDLGEYTPDAELAVVLDDSGRRHVTEIAPIAARRASDSGGGASRGSGMRGGARARAAAQQRRRLRESPRTQRVIEGTPTARHRVGDRSWDIPVTGFWQGHRAAPQAYSDSVAEFVEMFAPNRASDAVFWDLYGGAGVFTATALDALGASQVHLVDSDSGALDAAATTFAADSSVTAHRGEVAALSAALPAPHVVILDPPRTGAGTTVIDRIAGARPELVIHVGCDIARFARDIELFGHRGYRAVAIRAFDAFPLTHHLEAIAALVPVPGE